MSLFFSYLASFALCFGGISICTAIIAAVTASCAVGAVSLIDLTQSLFKSRIWISFAVFATCSIIAGLLWNDLLQCGLTLVPITFLPAMAVIRFFIGLWKNDMPAFLAYRKALTATLPVSVLLSVCGCLIIGLHITSPH